MTALSFNEALFNKYRADQARDARGRFTSEGGSGGSAAASYERRFGTKPPKGMSQSAMRRWLAGGSKTAPGQHSNTSSMTGSEWQRRQRQRAKDKAIAHPRAKQAVKALDDLKQAATAASKDERDIGEKSLRAYEALKRVPDKVWYQPTFADKVWDFIISPEAGLWSMVGSYAGAPVIHGAALVATGLYLVMRYAYRKLVTLGRYAGVAQPPWVDRQGLRGVFGGSRS